MSPKMSLKNPFESIIITPSAGVAQLVERQPSKLNVAGSTPVSRSILECR